MAMPAVVLTRDDLNALLVSAAERGAKLALDARGHVDEWLDQDAAAAIVGCARSSIPTLCRRDGLPHKRVNRAYRFKRADLDAWLASRPTSRTTTPGGSRTLRSIPGGR